MESLPLEGLPCAFSAANPSAPPDPVEPAYGDVPVFQVWVEGSQGKTKFWNLAQQMVGDRTSAYTAWLHGYVEPGLTSAFVELQRRQADGRWYVVEWEGKVPEGFAVCHPKQPAFPTGECLPNQQHDPVTGRCSPLPTTPPPAPAPAKKASSAGPVVAAVVVVAVVAAIALS